MNKSEQTEVVQTLEAIVQAIKQSKNVQDAMAIAQALKQSKAMRDLEPLIQLLAQVSQAMQAIPKKGEMNP